MTPVHQVSLAALGLLAAASLLGNVAPAVADDEDSALHIVGDESSYLDLGAGSFNIQSHAGQTPTIEGRIEYRSGDKLLDIGPAAGVLANGRGGFFGYVGLYGDIAWGHFVLTPLGGVGGYSRGTGEDLGGPFAFRASAALTYQFDDRSRFGPQFAHVSNAGIYARNPGDNELLLTYALPLDLPF